MAVGTALLALLHTELNVLNFSMATVIVSFSIGLLLFTAGLYGLSGPASRRRPQRARSPTVDAPPQRARIGRSARANPVVSRE